jgi:hypothetical protein
MQIQKYSFMKKAFILITLVITYLNLSAQTSNVKHNPAGKWNFEAPTAPGGYTAGEVDVVSADNKYSGTMSFAGNDYKFPVDLIKFENDSLKINLNVEGSDVSIKIKFDDSDKMSGVAVTNDSDIPLVLTREKAK